MTDTTGQARLAEITLRLVWAGADIHTLDFLRWLVQNNRNPEWELEDAATDNGVSAAFFLG
ncbi:MAG: hypothetical protein ACHQ7M_16890 [Chloroflexota bacterium]